MPPVSVARDTVAARLGLQALIARRPGTEQWGAALPTPGLCRVAEHTWQLQYAVRLETCCCCQVQKLGRAAAAAIASAAEAGGCEMRMPGVEPGSQAWEACMMPLHYVRSHEF